MGSGHVVHEVEAYGMGMVLHLFEKPFVSLVNRRIAFRMVRLCRST